MNLKTLLGHIETVSAAGPLIWARNATASATSRARISGRWS